MSSGPPLDGWVTRRRGGAALESWRPFGGRRPRPLVAQSRKTTLRNRSGGRLPGRRPGAARRTRAWAVDLSTMTKTDPAFAGRRRYGNARATFQGTSPLSALDQPHACEYPPRCIVVLADPANAPGTALICRQVHTIETALAIRSNRLAAGRYTKPTLTRITFLKRSCRTLPTRRRETNRRHRRQSPSLHPSVCPCHSFIGRSSAATTVLHGRPD